MKKTFTFEKQRKEEKDTLSNFLEPICEYPS